MMDRRKLDGAADESSNSADQEIHKSDVTIYA